MSLRIVTKSGAIYDYRVDDEDRTFIRRRGPYSDGIDYDHRPDDRWLEVSDHSEIDLGSSIIFTFPDGLPRFTTAVVTVEEVED
jgi:hypothetical protein